MITKNDRGIDVSYWQGNIDFNKVKASGYTFVIPRCSVADVDTGNQFVDKNFHANVNNALKAGLVVPGVYLFSMSCSSLKSCCSEMRLERVAKSCLALS